MATFVEAWNYVFSANIAKPVTPAVGEVRFNNAVPYANVTKVWIMFNTADTPSRDVSSALLAIAAGAALYIEQRDNAAAWVLFTVTGPPVNTGNYYVEIPVKLEDAVGDVGAQLGELPIIIRSAVTRGASGPDDAPTDGLVYGRHKGKWRAIAISGVGQA